ncbi:fibrobacter succinogenes major paralogous domain-containing protein [Lutimonas vermicola]|uniref:Fibrobacter succinogenes major paralogous domain-containing protein n=1 Tax=Lutimonas vermicola TaxID=414288 RepID=A0ABU9L267_9FLAO
MRIIHFFILATLLITSCEQENDEVITVTEDDPTTITDIDGNTYHTVRIGTQLWLVENLRTTRFQNGDLINELDESNSEISSFASYNNDENLAKTYGYLYNENAARDVRKIAPKGWHVPSGKEWLVLLNYVENRSEKLKIKGSTHWINGNSDATNESGFTALPGGEYNFTFNRFGFLGSEGNWWLSESLVDPGLNDSRFNISTTGSGHKSIGFVTFHEGNLYSIRCIRD